MATHGIAPRLVRDAIIGMDPMNLLASLIVFQYNQDIMTHRLEAHSVGGEDGDRSEPFRITGPPKETITPEHELDAAGQLEQADPWPW